MTTLADKAILSDADSHPPMLEKDMYDSWKSQMDLYMINRQRGRMILESVKNAIQVDCDVKATNIILQGLPPEVYALVSNHKFEDTIGKNSTAHARNFIDETRKGVSSTIRLFQPDTGLIVLVFLKGDDPIDVINHMMSFLTAVVTSRGDKILWLLVLQDHTHQDQVETIQGNRGQLYVITVKEKDTCQSNVQSQRGKGMKHGSRIRQALGFQNPCYLKKAQQLEPKVYDDSVIQKTNAIVIRDSEETLMLEEESRSKMLQKQEDPMISEKKVNKKPVDYAALNQLLQDFKTRFVPQTELSAEQVFWSQNSVNSVNSEEPNLFTRPTQVEVPKELLKVSMVNSRLKKLKYHLASFDVVVKERTTATAITEGT
nr:hypothetical protein [Tanacetum cinerariifolium]